jgi:hypothetical protein
MWGVVLFRFAGSNIPMRFAVPQFIDVEDKIFGPLTLKQAIYLAGAVGVGLVVFTRWGLMAALILGAPIGIVAFALAFAKVNNRPLVDLLYAYVFYASKHKLYLWKKTMTPVQQGEGAGQLERSAQQVLAPHLSQSRLKELAWSLDTKESMYNEEGQWK